MRYEQQKGFELFPSMGDCEEEWNKCIITIDERPGIKTAAEKRIRRNSSILAWLSASVYLQNYVLYIA